MEQFRENEVKKIREEERDKCQLELQTLRKEVRRAETSSIDCFLLQLELLHKSKLETLNEKELKIGERFKAELEVRRGKGTFPFDFSLVCRTNVENCFLNGKRFSKN